MKRKVKIIRTPFPEIIQGNVYGVLTENRTKDGFLIVIDSSRAPIVQRHTLGHELAHLFCDHFYSGREINDMERESNSLAWHYYRLYRDGMLQGVTG